MEKLILFSIVILAFPISYTALNSVKANELEALSDNNKHYYIGLRSGWENFGDACLDNRSKCSKDTIGYGVYGGYQFTSWFSLEGALTNYGSPEARYNLNSVSADVWGGDFTGVLSYRTTERLDAYFRAGLSYQHIDKSSLWDDENNILDDDQSIREWGLVSAIGLGYKLSKVWSIRGEYQINVDVVGMEPMPADISFLSLGLTYHFGQ